MDKVYHKRDICRVPTCLRPGLNCYFPKESGCLLRCTARDRTVRCIQPSETFVKEAPKHVDANETSILTVINQHDRKCDAVLTGDSTAIEILPLVEGKEIGIFQVPHHGSSSNSRLKEKSKLVEYAGEYNLSIAHNNEVKEIQLFYSTFRAQCYLISAGGTESYKHPHRSVLQGIILANSLRHQECVIVLTNSRGLNSEKLKQLHRLAPQWTRYVKIYHLDDIFFTELHHTSLRPQRCISDVRANTVEWTPEGYINRAKMMLPVKPAISNYRPLEKNRFIEQSTVEITVQGTLKFSADIICIPLPHNPRSGDRINCCYVIEESIASGVDLSKALFLRDNGERLSRAKKYVLFQYINNEWQRKELPATVQDKSPRASPCDIPYDSINSLWPVQDSSAQISPSLTPHQRINSSRSSPQQEQNISRQTPPSCIPHRNRTSVQTVQNISSQTPSSCISHRSRNSVQPVQNISPQSPHSRIQHQSVHSDQPVQNVSLPRHNPNQSVNSAQPPQNVSPKTHLIRTSHVSRTSLQPVRTSSPSTPPSCISHENVYSVQPAQNTSSQIPPSIIPHQSDLQPVHCQAFSPQISPNHIPHQNIIPDISQQISLHDIQLQQDVSALRTGSEGATAATGDYADIHVPQHGLQGISQATQHRPSPAQYYSEYESPSNGCRCKLTDCSTKICGCKKHGLYCGPNCRCTDCKNNQQFEFHLAQGRVMPFQFQPVLDSSPQISPYDMQQLHQDISALQIGSKGAALATSWYAEPEVLLQHRAQAAQHATMRPSPAQYYGLGEYESPTKGCRCQKTDCSTNRCGCRKRGLYCELNCQCTDCKNNQQYAFQLAAGQSRVIPDQTKRSLNKGCGCTTGCATRRCGCKKQGLHCGPSCKCQNTYFNCEN